MSSKRPDPSNGVAHPRVSILIRLPVEVRILKRIHQDKWGEVGRSKLMKRDALRGIWRAEP